MARTKNAPARGYKWKQFEPGHMANLRHGAKSPRIVDPIAQRLIEDAVAARPYLADPAYTAAVWAWGRAEARIMLCEDYIAEHGMFDDRGKQRNVVDILLRSESMAANLRSRLGLDPLSQSKLGRNIAAANLDLAELMSRASEGDAKAVEAVNAIAAAMGTGTAPLPNTPEAGPATVRDDENDQSDDDTGDPA